MSTTKSTPEDWFAWAETYLADSKHRSARWQELFSERAVQVLEFARQAAVSLNHDAVGAEHLLAAILKVKSGITMEALKSVGLSLPILREAIEADLGPSGRKKHLDCIIPWTPRAKAIVERSKDSVRAKDRTRVEPEDILLEILKEEEGLPARMFRERNIDMQKLTDQLLARRGHR